VSADGRGNTHRGFPATLPDGLYEPSIEPVTADRSGPAGLIVNFRGEDGREHAFDISALPLPGWHQALAEAWAKRIGPEGSLRTLASVLGTWYVLARFMRFMAQRFKPPATPAELTRADIEAFYNRDNGPQWSGADEIRRVTLLFAVSPLRELINADVNDYVRKPVLNGTDHGEPGYSDAEYRRILNAARADAAAIRDRIRRGRTLVQLWRNDREGLTAEDSRLAEQLAAIAGSGDVPDGPIGTTASITRFRCQLAQHLYVTKADVTPLMLLLVALTGLNAESVKELPAAHRVLDGHAVELEFVKRRRGAGHWKQTVTWEIGPSGRELHNPGGLYLLLLDLMTPSRAISGSPMLWSIWRDGHRLKLTTAHEHYSPFDGALHTHIARSQAWSARRGLLADGDDRPLAVTMQRLRTTVEIRRTKQMGGHLPSAAKTNTIHTLFRDYLRDDPVVRDWAGDVVTDALADAERAALEAHRRALMSSGGKLDVTTDGSGLGDGGNATAWASCRTPDQHPQTGKPCLATFLDCFHCQNCLITTSHLPRLLALMSAFTQRRRVLGEAEWWSRYGHVWAAIRKDVLPRFTPAQLEQARAKEPCDALLDLVEAPWENP
jgi:hypothetical protein